MSEDGSQKLDGQQEVAVVTQKSAVFFRLTHLDDLNAFISRLAPRNG
jgi:hypothetical protein